MAEHKKNVYEWALIGVVCVTLLSAFGSLLWASLTDQPENHCLGATPGRTCSEYLMKK